MAQQVAALMSMGGAYGSDPTAMLQAAAIQQQRLMYGGGEYILIIFLKMGEPPGGEPPGIIWAPMSNIWVEYNLLSLQKNIFQSFS